MSQGYSNQKLIERLILSVSVVSAVIAILIVVMLYISKGIFMYTGIVLALVDLIVLGLYHKGKIHQALHLTLLNHLILFAISPLIGLGVLGDILVAPTVFFFLYVISRSEIVTWTYIILITLCNAITIYGLHIELNAEQMNMGILLDLIIAASIMGVEAFIITIFQDQMLKFQQETNENELALITKNQQLQEYISTNMQLENFAHIASHELKTPVRSISNYAGLLQRSAGEWMTDEEKTLLDKIRSRTNSMYKLTNDLLELSKISHTAMSVEKIDFPGFLDHIISTDFGKQREMLVIEELPDQIVGNPKLLARLFHHILHRAIDRTHSGMVTISSHQIESGHAISVIDKGPIMTDTALANVFASIGSGQEGSAKDMILPICKKIVEKHDGTVQLINNPDGTGTRFSLELPNTI